MLQSTAYYECIIRLLLIYLILGTEGIFKLSRFQTLEYTFLSAQIFAVVKL